MSPLVEGFGVRESKKAPLSADNRRRVVFVIKHEALYTAYERILIHFLRCRRSCRSLMNRCSTHGYGCPGVLLGQVEWREPCLFTLERMNPAVTPPRPPLSINTIAPRKKNKATAQRQGGPTTTAATPPPPPPPPP